MRLARHTIVLLVAAAALLWWMMAGVPRSRQSAAPEESPSPPGDRPVHDSPVGAMSAPSQPVGQAGEWRPREMQSPGDDHERRAFRFVLSDGKLELEAVEDLQGDFHPRRGRPAWQQGMLCCRLLDEQQRVLAEETVPAPDRICIVLDPNTAGADGKPQPAVLSPSGPVVFQVRLPKVDSATHMKVYRIAGSQPAAPDEEPAGQLLATIPLAR